jgi:hypothetical protein
MPRAISLPAAWDGGDQAVTTTPGARRASMRTGQHAAKDDPMRRKNRAWSYFRQSDPDLNPQFRRDWSETAPARRKQAGAAKSAAQRQRETKKA